MDIQEENQLNNCLLQLKTLLKNSDDNRLQAVVGDDAFLQIFIIGRKYNVKYAFETMKGYMKMRYVKHADIYAIPTQSVKHVLQSGFMGLLKNKDHNGRAIAFVRFAKMDVKTFNFEDVVRSIILLAESEWYNVDHVRNGQVLIADFTGYNISIMTRYTISEKIALINIFWHNYPSKIKGLHAYNNPKLFGYAYSLIRPFLPDKFKRRVRLHGKDLESLHEFISPDILPTFLGGRLTEEEAIDLQLIQRVISS